MKKTCIWHDHDFHCQEIATIRITAGGNALLAENWYFCDEHTKIMLQTLAQSEFTTVPYIAYRIEYQ